MILTIAASISCLRSSSTLLRVSRRSGSVSPLAATVCILTLRGKFEYYFKILEIKIWYFTCEVLRRIRRWRWIRLKGRFPLSSAFEEANVAAVYPSRVIEVHGLNPFQGCRTLAESLRKSFAHGCWRASERTSVASQKVFFFIWSQRLLKHLTW